MITFAIEHHDSSYAKELADFLTASDEMQRIPEIRLKSLPDVAIVAIGPDKYGLKTPMNLYAVEARTKVIIVSANGTWQEAKEALKCRAAAYIYEPAGFHAIQKAIHLVMQDKKYIRCKNNAQWRRFIPSIKRKKKNYYQMLLDKGVSREAIHSLLLKLIKHDRASN